MNILYLISCLKQGKGGHYYSLKTTADEMNKTNRVFIASIGTDVSPVFKNMQNYFPITTRFPTYESVRKIISIVKENNIDVIHSFDDNADFFARITSNITKVPALLTKCGGPIPKKYYPKTRTLVVFSLEDMHYFNKSRKHQRTNLLHIPNRVCATEQDQIAIKELKKGIDPEATILLRISRFSKLHKKSIMDSINIVKCLRKDGLKVSLLVIGTKDSDVYEEIIKQAPIYVKIVTDDKYTVNASRLINIADVVVGTGRGAMEAAIQGCALLAPVEGLSMPVLVTKDNIETFLEYNFSSRTVVHGISLEAEYLRVKNILTNQKMLSNMKNFIRCYAEKHFNIFEVRDKYETIYKECPPCELNIIDSIIHYYYTSKPYLSKLIRRFKS